MAGNISTEQFNNNPHLSNNPWLRGYLGDKIAPQNSYSQIESMLDAWYAKKQPLQRSEAAPNTNIYTPSYSSDATQQAAGTSTQQAPVSQPAPQQRQDYGWQPQLFMGAYGMQSPFRGYGMMSGYGGGYGYGGISGYNNYYSPFGGGMGYGQMYNPFSMY